MIGLKRLSTRAFRRLVIWLMAASGVFPLSSRGVTDAPAR